MTPQTPEVSSKDARYEIIDFVARYLIGPTEGPGEVLRDSPLTRYGMGILFPREAPAAEALEDDEENPASGDDSNEDGEASDETIRHASKWLPASCGLSFYTDAARVRVRVHGATYERTKEGEKASWSRVELASEASPEEVVFDTAERTKELNLWGEAAVIRVVSRPLGEGHLVTVTLLNARTPSGNNGKHAESDNKDADSPGAGQKDTDQARPDECLFQVGFSCVPENGSILEYPSARPGLMDPEEQELRLVYRRHRSFGVGHGCSVAWAAESNGKTSEIRTSFMPLHEVPALTTQVGSSADILRLSYLADPGVETGTLVQGLRAFAGEYRQWINTLPDKHLDIRPSLASAKQRLIERLNTACDRIESGIDLIAADPLAARTFRLANQAMLAQMVHAKVARDWPDHSRQGAPNASHFAPDPTRAWRPFQLAFFLLSLPSIHDREHKDRTLVDLIWFPTGGGKTEAYLAVAAYLVLLRRLRSGDGGAGTVIMTRYTLRLLTAQQFQRAAILMCALELMRRQEPAVYGQKPITIGLWAGNEVSPNKCVKAKEKFEELKGLSRPDNPFVLENCPWCGTAILPGRQSSDAGDYGIRAENQSFSFYCPNEACDFHDVLPVQVVDEELYRQPPTFLVGTVDKFARLAWDDRPGSFFGGPDLDVDPPELIIQDELHLISGPLGTVVGLYESGILSVITARGGRPKVISSTATIRRAHEQSAELFGRKVALFPPSGLSAEDSYFSKQDDASPGRLYVGVMSPNLSYKSAIVHLMTALMQAPRAIALGEGEQDSYSTLVAYHNTIRDLGQSLNLARDDVPARLKVLWPDEAQRRQLDDEEILELTSNVGGQRLTRVLGRLERSPSQRDFVSVLATTNMISVGVDVPRLGLMTMVGQPKTTSEYIQASSRVGRGEIPGIVTVLYSTSKARDRSHYETFPTFHQSLYQYVEPTTVTPFSLQSRRRALHAAFVILVRHGVPGMNANEAPKKFDPTDLGVLAARQLLLDWVGVSDLQEAEVTRLQLDDLIATWGAMAQHARDHDRPLYYEADGAQHKALLTPFGKAEGTWPTLNSMRNVDTESIVQVLGR